MRRASRTSKGQVRRTVGYLESCLRSLRHFRDIRDLQDSSRTRWLPGGGYGTFAARCGLRWSCRQLPMWWVGIIYQW